MKSADNLFDSNTAGGQVIGFIASDLPPGNALTLM